MAQDIISLWPRKTRDQIVDALESVYGERDLSAGLDELASLTGQGLLRGKQNPQKDTRFDLDAMRTMPVNMLVMDITDCCNLVCSYCFAKRGKISSSRMMSKKTAVSAVDLLFEMCGPRQSLAVRFFGGEPLLNLGIMKETLPYAVRRAEQAGKEVTFLLSTNGTIMTEEVLRLIAQYKVKTCVSMDGPQDLHDTHRRFKNGRGSFATVHTGLRKLLAHSPMHVQAQAVLTRQTGGSLREMAPFFRDLGFGGVYVGFVADDDERGCSLSEDFLQGFHDTYVELLTDCMLAAEPCRFSVSGHDLILSRIHRAEKTHHGCHNHAGVNMVHVDAYGAVFPCYRLIGPDLCLGNVRQGREPAAGHRVRRDLANDHVDVNACRDCWARYLCGGRCPAQCRDKPEPASPEDCRQRERMALNLRLYAHLWLKHRSLLEQRYGHGTTES